MLPIFFSPVNTVEVEKIVFTTKTYFFHKNIYLLKKKSDIKILTNMTILNPIKKIKFRGQKCSYHVLYNNINIRKLVSTFLGKCKWKTFCTISTFAMMLS